jgi:hypothetical protein
MEQFTVEGKTYNVPTDPKERERFVQLVKSIHGVDVDQTSVLGQIAEIPKGLARGALGIAIDVPLGLSSLLDVGNDGQTTTSLREASRRLREDSPFAAAKGYEDTFTTKLSEGFGSFAPFFGAGLVGRALAQRKLVSPIVGQYGLPAAIAVPAGVSQQADRIEVARQLGEDVGPFAETFAEIGGGAVGLSEILPVSYILSKTSKTALKNNVLKEKIKRALLSGGFEGGQEVFASVAQDLIARGLYSDQLPIGDSLLDEFTIGGIVGATTDFVLNSFAGRRGIANAEFLDREQRARNNRETILSSKKFEKATEQGIVSDILEQPDQIPPDIPLPAERQPEPNLVILNNTKGTFDLYNKDTNEFLLQDIATEAEARVEKQKKLDAFAVNDVKAEIENVLYILGLQKSSTATEVGSLLLDNNSTRVSLKSLFNFNQRLSEKDRQNLLKSPNFEKNKNKTFSFEEAVKLANQGKLLNKKELNLLQKNLADTVFKKSEENGLGSIRDDKNKINTSVAYIKDLIASKNIDIKSLKDPAVRYFAKATTGYAEISKAPVGAKQLFIARLHSLPNFNIKVPFPDFSPRKHNAVDVANFVSNLNDNLFTLKDLQKIGPESIRQNALDQKIFLEDLLNSGRVEKVNGNKYRLVKDFAYNIARRAEGFKETPEEFGNRLRQENELSEEAIKDLVEKEQLKQSKFLPPAEIVPKMINFDEAIKKGRLNKFAKEVRKMLDVVGLRETGIVISDELLSTRTLVEKEDGTIVRDPEQAKNIKGEYDKNTDIIFVSLNAINPDGTASDLEIQQRINKIVDGNVIEALREKDLFTEKEYQFFRNYIRRAKVPSSFDKNNAGISYYQRSLRKNSNKAAEMQAYGAGKDALEEMYVESAIADLYKSRFSPADVAPKAESIFGKVEQFFDLLGKAVNRSGMKRASEIFSIIEEGKLGARERGEIRTTKELDRLRLDDELRPILEIDETLETTEEKPVKDEPLSETEIEQETSRRVNRGQVSPIGQVTEITPDMTLEEIKPRLKGGIYNLLKLTDKQKDQDYKYLMDNIVNKTPLEVAQILFKNAPSKDYRIIAKKIVDRLEQFNKIGVKTSFTVIKDNNDVLPLLDSQHYGKGRSLGFVAGPAPKNLLAAEIQRTKSNQKFASRFEELTEAYSGFRLYINDLAFKSDAVNYEVILHELVHLATQGSTQSVRTAISSMKDIHEYMLDTGIIKKVGNNNIFEADEKIENLEGLKPKVSKDFIKYFTADRGRVNLKFLEKLNIKGGRNKVLVDFINVTEQSTGENINPNDIGKKTQYFTGVLERFKGVKDDLRQKIAAEQNLKKSTDQLLKIQKSIKKGELSYLLNNANENILPSLNTLAAILENVSPVEIISHYALQTLEVKTKQEISELMFAFNMIQNENVKLEVFEKLQDQAVIFYKTGKFNSRVKARLLESGRLFYKRRQEVEQILAVAQRFNPEEFTDKYIDKILKEGFKRDKFNYTGKEIPIAIDVDLTPLALLVSQEKVSDVLPNGDIRMEKKSESKPFVQPGITAFRKQKPDLDLARKVEQQSLETMYGISGTFNQLITVSPRRKVDMDNRGHYEMLLKERKRTLSNEDLLEESVQIHDRRFVLSKGFNGSNVQEFLAVGLTNRGFQGLLKEIKLEQPLPISEENFLSQFVKEISKLLNIPADTKNVFSNFLILSEALTLSKYAGGTLGLQQLVGTFGTYKKAKRYSNLGSLDPPSSQNVEIERNLRKAEYDVKSTPLGQIPTFNLNASDIAINAAVNFNNSAVPEQDIPLPKNEAVVPPEYAQQVKDLGYEKPVKVYGERLIDYIENPIASIKQQFSTIRTSIIDKYDEIHKDILRQKTENEEIRQLENTADSSAIAAVRLGERSRGIFQGLLTNGYPTALIDGQEGATRTQALEIEAKYNPFVAPEKADVINETTGEVLREAGKTYGGFMQITAPLYADPTIDREAIFALYRKLKRIDSFDKQGKKITTPRTEKMKETMRSIEKNYPSVVEVSNNYDRWNNKLIDFAVQKEVLSPETAKLWKEHSSYYPFYRKMVDGDLAGPNIAVGVLPNNVLGIKIKGSEDPIDTNPIEAISRNSLAILTAALKNDGIKKLVRNYRLETKGKDVDSAGHPNTIAFFENVPNEAGVIENKKVFYQLEDKLVHDALRGLGGVSTDGVVGILAKPASFLRDTVTRDPGFVVVNILRDTLSSAVTSGATLGGDGFVPIIDSFKNMMKDVSELEQFGIVGGYDFSNDEGSIKEFIDRTRRQQGLSLDNGLSAKNAFFKVWDGLGALTTKSDAVTRKAVFRAVYNHVKKNGGTEAQAQSEAAYQALEIINFGRRGLSPTFRIITSAIPFLNARIQGLDVLFRAFTGQYSSIEKLEAGETMADVQNRIIRTAFLRGGTLMLITLIYYALVSDTEEYKSMRREERDDNWVIPLPGDIPSVKIPIPFEVGAMFKAIPERLLDASPLGRQIEGDPTESILRQAGTSLNIPFFQPGAGIQVLKPIAEAMANRNSFTNTEIVPYYQLKLENELQTRKTTNKAVEELAKTFGLSPIVTEHVLRGYGGTLGGYVLNFADIVARGVTGENLIPTNLNNLPLLRRFFRDPNISGGGLQQQFYELRNEVDTAVASMNRLREQKRFDELRAYRSNVKGLNDVRGRVRALERYLDAWRNRRDRLYDRDDISASVRNDLLIELEAERDRRLAIVPELRKRAKAPIFSGL